MNDPMRAVAILREAKQILSSRLTERVLEAGEEILADARGESYMNDIETVYEQVGIKLAHINQMLSNLPTDGGTPTPKAAATQARPEASPVADHDGGNDGDPKSTSSTTASLPALSHRVTRALPAPKPNVKVIPLPHGSTNVGARPRSFQAFANQIQAGDLLAAGQSLAELFDLPEARAVVCATVFADRLRRDRDFISRATQLRAEIEEGSYNRAIVLLHDCFGLTALEAMTVLQSLRR